LRRKSGDSRIKKRRFDLCGAASPGGRVDLMVEVRSLRLLGSVIPELHKRDQLEQRGGLQ
jgi:hypothetical protein